MSSDGIFHVRGHTHTAHPASPGVVFLALLSDFLLLTTVSLKVLVGLGFAPVPDFTRILLVLLPAAILIGVGLFFLRTTPALWIWNIRRTDRGYTRLTRGFSANTQAFGTLFAFWIVSSWLVLSSIGNHPLWIQGPILQISAFVPPQDSQSSNWQVLPFYYSTGAWPVKFNEAPVLYSVPYEKGPPTHFVGRIVARWDTPRVRVIIEGPKTPTTPEISMQVQECLKKSGFSGFSCLSAKHAALSRHIHELERLSDGSSLKWHVRWFEIQNDQLPSSQRMQGIYLSAATESRIQERFVAIGPQGAHQAFVLQRPTEGSDMARELFLQALGSQRISPDLLSGRAWVNRALSQLNLKGLGEIQSEDEFLNRLSRVQALLVSKISVDPKTLDTYFHLGGTSYLLAKRAGKGNRSEWGAVAEPLIQSAYLFARDIAPKSRHTEDLHGYWLDVKSL